jgi:hypothetical protein
MTFVKKAERKRLTGASLLIPMPVTLRRQAERYSEEHGCSLSETGRRALQAFLTRQAPVLVTGEVGEEQEGLLE